MKLKFEDPSKNVKRLEEATGESIEELIVRGTAKALRPLEQEIYFELLKNEIEGEIGFLISTLPDDSDRISIGVYYAPLETFGLWFELGMPLFEFSFPFRFFMSNPEEVKGDGEIEGVAFDECSKEASKIIKEGFPVFFKKATRRIRAVLQYRHSGLEFFREEN
ncbi:hypothetical protein J7J23_03115 [bacterium]|nr:hypothetical protein [bacterium]